MAASPVMAAPAYVQGAMASNNNSAATIAEPFTAANTAGNLIVAAASWDNGGGNGTLACSDSVGNSYQYLTVQNDATHTQSLASATRRASRPGRIK